VVATSTNPLSYVIQIYAQCRAAAINSKRLQATKEQLQQKRLSLREVPVVMCHQIKQTSRTKLTFFIRDYP
jgi:hypothetical protein